MRVKMMKLNQYENLLQPIRIMGEVLLCVCLRQTLYVGLYHNTGNSYSFIFIPHYFYKLSQLLFD